MQRIGATGDGKSAVASPDGKKPKEEQVVPNMSFSQISEEAVMEVLNNLKQKLS